ncbi:50S ribosome-binding GTPase [Kineosporia sp. J2-2]|uniref:50S ribosome-binding GTPase n=1 Tax=Kineosporia corallincola TaxID=2835133 RepID=A0ABS5TMD7_9ACTN|nr:GTPase [Kineosporia corallincola]MBT0772165.1 50S ribosome-binding GTPase [Kineosporia corallincola]
MAPAPRDWFSKQFGDTFDEKAREIGRFNLAIFGKTGVGKSTLVNAIFGEDVAETGIGQPVTQGSHLYLHADGHFGVLDTRGLEIGTDDGTILAELEQYVREMRRSALADQVHVAWYCVRAGDRRFEDTEEAFIRGLDRLGLSVLLVLTQVPMRDGRYHPDAIALRDAIAERELPLGGHPIFLTNAKADDFAGLEAHGLQELLDATFLVAPAGVQDALVAAQKIDMKRKRASAEKAIRAAVGASAAAGATPIPFSDAAVLVPIQLTMMATISHIYDVGVDRATAAALAATAAATAGGRSLVTGLIKSVPGAGSLIGGGIAAAVASSVTWAVGQAWTTVCSRLSQGKLTGVSGALDSDAIRELFLDEFRGNMRKKLPGGFRSPLN